MLTPLDPAVMTPAERLAEIGSTLAVGLARLRARRAELAGQRADWPAIAGSAANDATNRPKGPQTGPETPSQASDPTGQSVRRERVSVGNDRKGGVG